MRAYTLNPTERSDSLLSPAGAATYQSMRWLSAELAVRKKEITVRALRNCSWENRRQNENQHIG